jgi:hypothetical protein
METALTEAISAYFQQHPEEPPSYAVLLERIRVDEKDVAAEMAAALVAAGWTNPEFDE